MSKTRLIALSGICSAVAVVCMIVCSVAPWAMLILSVVASIAVVIPLIVDSKGLGYTLLVYAVAGLIGTFAAFEFGGLVYAAPCVSFCMPFAIVKVRGESVKVQATLNEKQTLDDPFDQDTKIHVAEVQLQSKKPFPTVVKWVLYYILLEVGIGLTMLSAYLLMPDFFTQIVNNELFWLLIVAAQAIVVLYDLLLRGCLIGTTKILRKIIK